MGIDRKRISTEITKAMNKKTEGHTLIAATIRKQSWTGWKTWKAVTSVFFQDHGVGDRGMSLEKAFPQPNCLDINVCINTPLSPTSGDQSEYAWVERSVNATEFESISSTFSRATISLASELHDYLNETDNVRAVIKGSQASRRIYRKWIVWPISQAQSCQEGHFLHLGSPPSTARFCESDEDFSNTLEFRRTSLRDKIWSKAQSLEERISIDGLGSLQRSSYPLILLESKEGRARWLAKAYPRDATVESVFAVPMQIEVKILVIKASSIGGRRAGGQTGTLTVGDVFFQPFSVQPDSGVGQSECS